MVANKPQQLLAKYPELNVRLETVLAQLQDPNVEVDAAVKYYEEAAKLIAEIETCLEDAQNQISQITAKYIKES